MFLSTTRSYHSTGSIAQTGSGSSDLTVPSQGGKAIGVAAGSGAGMLPEIVDVVVVVATACVGTDVEGISILGLVVTTTEIGGGFTDTVVTTGGDPTCSTEVETATRGGLTFTDVVVVIGGGVVVVVVTTVVGGGFTSSTGVVSTTTNTGLEDSTFSFFTDGI